MAGGSRSARSGLRDAAPPRGNAANGNLDLAAPLQIDESLDEIR